MAEHRGASEGDRAGTAASAVREGKEKARELGDDARREARSRADEQRAQVADGMRSVAHALRQGRQELPEDRRQYGRVLETVADRVEDVSGYLDEHDVDDMVRDAQRFARDNTALFLGGAFTLGMAGARFLKASGTQPEPRSPMAAEHGRGGDGVESRSDEPAPRMGEPSRQQGDPLDEQRPARPYPRSSSPREATERIQEEGGYA